MEKQHICQSIIFRNTRLGTDPGPHDYNCFHANDLNLISKMELM